MDTTLAYCGLACNSCPIHLATLEQDGTKRRSMREGIAKVCTEKYGMDLATEDITDCDGCRAGKRLFSGCAQCKIRKCAMDRKLENCAVCRDYACDKLLKHFEADPSARVRLETIRSGS